MSTAARFLVAVSSAISLIASSCATDPYLTCGPKCSDGDGGDGSNLDASSVTETGAGDSACTISGNLCKVGGDCCSGVCGGNQTMRCCQQVNTPCMTNPDTCCSGARCKSGMCAMCSGTGTPCAEDIDCCNNVCGFGDTGVKHCLSD